MSFPPAACRELPSLAFRRKDQLRENHIGADLTGKLARPNQLDGVFIYNAPNNTVGGGRAATGTSYPGTLATEYVSRDCRPRGISYTATTLVWISLGV